VREDRSYRLVSERHPQLATGSNPDADFEAIHGFAAGHPAEKLFPRSELDIGTVQQQRARVIRGFQGLLEQEQGLKKAGLPRAVSASQNR